MKLPWFPPVARCWMLLAIAVTTRGQIQNQIQIQTLRQPSTNTYHGAEVVEDYQWLEKADDPTVQSWTRAQDRRTREWLEASPARPLIETRLKDLLADASASFSSMTCRRGRLFLLRFTPPEQHPVLISLWSTNKANKAQVVFDPNRFDPSGGTAIDWYVPSADGAMVAICLSENGSEVGRLHFYEMATGRQLDDVVPRVQFPTGGGSAAWAPDGSGVFYTRYPAPAERPADDQPFYQQVYFHKLGTGAAQDRYEIGRDFPRIAEIELRSSPDGRFLLAAVANGDGGEFAHWLRGSSGEWRQVTRFEDKIKQVEFGRPPLYIEWPREDSLYLLSHRDAPHGKILRLSMAHPDLAKAVVSVAETTNEIGEFQCSASGLYVAYLRGGPSELVFFDDFDLHGRVVAFRTPTAIQQLVVSRGDELFFRTESYTEPYAWNRFDPNEDRDHYNEMDWSGQSPVSFVDIEVVRESVRSKDGTWIPLNIIRRRGTHLDGHNPTILTGYGGYGISLTPTFDFTRRVWLDQGGVIAIANLRGGGEFGENWHTAGKLTHKQNVFDDFIACAEFLVRSNYTSSSQLAVEGGSNGGLLMGAFLTQRPDLARAVVSHVGIYDMLRVELDPNGAFNVTEFGTVKDRDQFQALRAYSPYQHVQAGVAYPSVLLLTGEHDGRVNPAHSRKMTARLQAATSSEHPILLRTSSSSGHGMGTALGETIAQLADVYTFLFRELGLNFNEVDRGPWSGALTPTSATVKARLWRPGLSARLAISQEPGFANPTFTAPQRSESDRHNLVAFDLTHLEPDTPYEYALEIDGRLDRTKHGHLRTFPQGPASFKFAFASCARTGSTSDVFDRIRENHPLFFLHMGDFHYLNIQTNLRSRYYAAYDQVLASIQQAELFRNIPIAYVWDDHDFGGNNSNRKASSHEAARASYHDYVPHYPLALGGGPDEPICQSFSVGRVKFILTDLRSERDDVKKVDDEHKSMMGQQQKAWFKQELLDARGKYPLICWMSTVPWMGDASTNYYHAVKTNQFGFIHHTNLVESPTRTNRNRGTNEQDHWSVFAAERREIADFIKSNHISGVCLLHGDAHMLGADDGSHSDYATGGGAPIPVLCAAPLDQEPSLKGGPYSQGVYRVKKNEGCFGLITVTDRGDAIDVAYSGRNNLNEEKISLKFTVPASPP